MIRLFIVPLFFLGAIPAWAQDNAVWQTVQQKFPDENAVFTERSETMNIMIKGDSLEVYSDIVEDVLYLKEQSVMMSAKRVYGSDFNSVENLKAKSLIWEKNKYKEMVVSDFKKNSDSDRRDGVFFDDSYYFSFNFPAVAPRNRSHLEYREVVKDARFISGYVFSSYLSQVKTTFTIKASKDIDIAYDVLNDPKKTIHFKKSEKGGMVTYEWSAAELKALDSDEGSPSIRYYAPHVMCYVKSYQTKKGKVNVLSNLDDLYRWYYTFVEKLNKVPSPELTKIAEGIKAKSKSELETVKNVYYWVQENIRYIAFEQGMRGLIPHDGAYVCEKRYGDCKDMANLIVNLLELAGVKAYHTWIGTRDLPYTYTAVPTPLVDNHMIATYISSKGEYYFLDGTSNHTPFGFPSSMIQGKEALIGKGPSQYEVKAVPVIDKEKNIMTDTMKIKLVGPEMVGSGTSTLHGFAKVFGGYELDRAEEEDVKKYVTKLLSKGSNKFFLDQYKIDHLKNLDKPTKLTYSFRIGDYFQQIGDEMYVNLNLNKDYYNAFINKETRTTPRELDYQYVKYEVIDLEIPKGYSVEYLPPNVKHDGPLLGFEMTYKALPGKIKFTKKFYLSYLLLMPDQFASWNESVKLVSEAYKESVIFKKN